jgi:drug/metabolite transporter (DMT)-like permease
MVNVVEGGAHRRWAVAALLFNALIWGVSWWPFRALQNEGVHPLWSTALVYGFAVICVLCIRPHAWRAFAQYPALWFLAIASGLTNVCFNWAVTAGDVVRVVLLFYLMPAWSVLLAWFILGEKPQLNTLLRLLLALSGVLLVLKQPESPWPLPHSLLDYLALFGGLSFALVNIMLRKLRDVPSEARMMGMFSGGALMAAAGALWGAQTGWITPLPALQWGWLGLALALATAFLCSNLALQYGAARLRASTTALVMLSEIVFASLSATLMGAAQLESRTIYGGTLILAAACWAAFADSQAAT